MAVKPIQLRSAGSTGAGASAGLEVAGREEWRRWLAAHGESAREIWLVFWKSHTGRDTLPYEDAVEEAVCFGWIDSIVRRLDDERFARKFTPRQDGSRWSQLNRGRFAKMEREGRMTGRGRAKGPSAMDAAAGPAASTGGAGREGGRGGTAGATATAAEAAMPAGAADAAGAAGGTEAAPARGAVELPAYLEAGLRAHPAAWACFCRLAPSHRRNYVRWIDAAKRQDTRERRIAEAVTLLVNNQRLGLK